MDFGKWLKRNRSARGWSQREVAKKIGGYQSNISKWERGVLFHSKSDLSKLEEVFGDTAPKEAYKKAVDDEADNTVSYYTTLDVANLLEVDRSVINNYILLASPGYHEYKKIYPGDKKGVYSGTYALTTGDIELLKEIHELKVNRTYGDVKKILEQQYMAVNNNAKRRGEILDSDSLLDVLKERGVHQAEVTETPSTELIDLTSESGEVLVSSRDVADKFNKQHRNILSAIRDLLKNKQANKMFTKVPYIHEVNNQQFDMYLMNRDGFSLLTMGFTGERALQWKLKYIEAFNEMEKQLKLDQPSYQIDDPVARAQAWIAEQKEKEELQLQNAQQMQLIGELKPAADYTDTILQSTNAVTITQIAKDYDMTGHGMNKLLHEMGVQYKVNGQWVPYKEHVGKGYTKSHTHEFDYGNGQIGSVMQTRWTQKGRLFIYNLLKEKGIVPLMEQ